MTTAILWSDLTDAQQDYVIARQELAAARNTLAVMIEKIRDRLTGQAALLERHQVRATGTGSAVDLASSVTNELLWLIPNLDMSALARQGAAIDDLTRQLRAAHAKLTPEQADATVLFWPVSK